MINFNGKNYDLKPSISTNNPCWGCAFNNEHCFEIVSDKCSIDGNGIWVENKKNKGF